MKKIPAQTAEPKAPEKKLRPEDMPEFQDELSQLLIKDWRNRLGFSDERIIESLRAL